MAGEQKLKAAICEDVREEAEWISEQINKWASLKKISAQTFLFEDAVSFDFTIEDTEYDALFLDIRMPGENGMELAKRLRKKGNQIPIVFVTGEREYMLEGYEVEAVHYLLKPVAKEKLFRVLDRIYGQMQVREPFLLLQTEAGIVRLLQREIYLVEVNGHRLLYRTTKGDYEVSSSLREAEEKLSGDFFVSCYRGILVNLLYVEAIEKNKLMLYDSESKLRLSVPVSRRAYPGVNEAFIRLFKE